MRETRLRIHPAAGAAIALTGLLLALAVLWPPEIHPWAQAACQALLAALILAAAWRPPRLFPPVPGWFALLALCAAAPVLAAACGARALDEAAYAVCLVAAGLAGRSVAAAPRGPAVLGLVLAALAVAVSAHAAAQRFVTYPALAAALRAADPADPGGVLVRLEAGRPSGPFVLPAALGGFVALALPWLALRAARGRGPGPRLAAGAALAAGLGGLALTKSVGALVAAAAGILIALPADRRRVAAAVVLAAALGGGWFLAGRDDVRAVPGGDPLTLRAGNWAAALRMIAERPVFGVGPGAFATHYPRAMRPGMNETRHAHNSYLEAAAGWGLWILAPVGLLVTAAAGAVRARRRDARDRFSGRGREAPDDRLALLAGGVAFLVHNLGDFTAYLPGVALPAAVALGCGIGPPAGRAAPRRPPAPAAGPWIPAPIARRAAAAVAAVALALHGAATARSRAALEAARVAAADGDHAAALAHARRGREARPDHPDPRAFLAQAILGLPDASPALRAEGECEAAAGLRLDPGAAVLHWTRALYHQAAGERAAAWRERHAAHLLYPLKKLYRPPDAAAPADGAAGGGR